MNNEIKEILDRLDFNEWDIALYKVPITWSELYTIRDYITNLQEENDKLKELCNKYEEEHSTEFKIWKDERQQLLDYKSRKEKAIEYMQIFSDFDSCMINGKSFQKAIDILKGVDKE